MKNQINFLSKLHLACSTDVLRPMMQLIHFKDGKIYATNGYILIKQDISVHSIDPNDHPNLEGKFIHKDTFKDIIKHPVAKFNPENIEAITKSGERIIYNYYKAEERFPDFDNIINAHEVNAINEISFSPKQLKIIDECLVRDGGVDSLKYVFNAKNRGIMVTTNDINKDCQFAILMPTMIYV